MRQIVAVIEQNMEMLRETAIHGSGDMKALAIALLRPAKKPLQREANFSPTSVPRFHQKTHHRKRPTN